MVNDNIAKIFAILKKKREDPGNALTPDENTILTEWLQNEHNLRFYEEYILTEGKIDDLFIRTLEAEEKIGRRLEAFTNPRKIRVIRIMSAVAAAAVVGGVVLVMLFKQRPGLDKSKVLATTNATMQPGKDRAYLTLADGSVVDLDTASGFAIARQKGAIISNNAGVVTYKSERTGQHEDQYNSISIPSGGQYRLQLPDGTRIWLNAATNLRFPVEFNEVERTVLLDGEAYFEVAKDRRPFRVKYKSAEGRDFTVNVLGTHFVVTAYKDNAATTATLVEGKISLEADGKRVLLSPGQQAQSRQGDEQLAVRSVDTDAATGWVTGSFYFTDSDIHTIVKSIGRWYNVPVVIEKDYKGELFSCKLSRSAPLDSVLARLRKLDVKVEIIDSRIVVK